MSNQNKTIKAIGEIVLRVKDMQVMREFYENILGLEIFGEFEKMIFFQIAPSCGGTYNFWRCSMSQCRLTIGHVTSLK